MRRGAVAGACRDRVVAFGIECLAGRSRARHTLTLQHRVDLLHDRLQALAAGTLGLDLNRALDAVDHVEPVADRRLPDLRSAPLDFARCALAVVLEIGNRAPVAILDPRQLRVQRVAGGFGDGAVAVTTGRGRHSDPRRRRRLLAGHRPPLSTAHLDVTPS